MQKELQKFVMRITNQEKQTNTYIKYSSNTAQHVRSFYTEQTNAVRIPVNFDLCSSAWSKEHYKMNTNIFHTHQNHTHPIKTRGTATKRERERGLQILVHRRWDGLSFTLLNACTL